MSFLKECSVEKLMNAKDVAAVLKLSRSTVYKLVNSGKLPTIRIGGALRFSPSAIEAWIMQKN
jgi:excisionase family DNA binding protein